jgi:hypothetical protein
MGVVVTGVVVAVGTSVIMTGEDVESSVVMVVTVVVEVLVSTVEIVVVVDTTGTSFNHSGW